MAKKVNFEEAMERLGEIVRKLEDGNVPLEESMRLYEEGMRLGSLCRRILKEAEQKIERLTAEIDAEPPAGKE